MSPLDRLGVSEEDLGGICRRHQVRRLSVFGSVLRGDFSSASDVDVLVEFAPGARVTFFSLARLEEALTRLFARRADVHLPRALSPYLRDRILAEAREMYVAA